MISSQIPARGNSTRAARYHYYARKLVESYFKPGATQKMRDAINRELLKRGFPPAPELKAKVDAYVQKHPEWKDAFYDPNYRHSQEDPKSTRYISKDYNGFSNTTDKGEEFDF
jgi:hypothetical protein